MTSRAKQNFLSVESWSHEQIDELMRLAHRVKRGEVKGGLEGKLLALVFLDPSLRTRTSFEAAMALHGGHAITIEPGKGAWPLETRPGVVMDGPGVEHVVDAARVLGRYAHALAVRCFPRGDTWAEARQDHILAAFASHCDKPVVNLESSRRHPCQELADLQTLQERLGETRGKKLVVTWAWHPKPLPTAVPVSAALAGVRAGMEVVIARPEGYDFDPEDTATLERIARERGATLRTTTDRHEAVRGAHAVYAKSWGALGHYGQPEAEATLRTPHRAWRVTPELMARTANAFFMHCLPVRRNVEVDDAVIDSTASAVYDEAENRMHAQRALLLMLLGGQK